MNELQKNLETNPRLSVKILIDAYRGTRNTKAGSKYISSYEMVNKLRSNNINRDVEVGLWRTSQKDIVNNLFKITEISEARGVHHIKVAIFDNSLILTGYFYFNKGKLRRTVFFEQTRSLLVAERC